MIPGLLVTEGPLKGTYIQFPEKKAFWIGRSPNSDFMIQEDPSVSNRHCHFLRTAKNLCMKDQSRNGTCLNNRKIQNEWAILKMADILRIGQTHLQVVDVDKNEQKATLEFQEVEAYLEDHEKAKTASPRSLNTLGPYRNIEVIGSGSFGVVYKSIHQEWQKLVALKVFTGQEGPGNRFMGRFLREAELLKKIDHPYLIRLYDAGKIEVHRTEFNYIAMEHFPGVNLIYHLKAYGPMNWPKVVKILCQLSDALAEMHQQGVIHRDIKPDNILYNDIREVAKIIDLGLGKCISDEERQTYCVTKTGSGLGTPYYMPIEQWKEAKDADERADIYALGATAYYLLSGQPPYAEFEDYLEVFRAITGQKLTPLTQLCTREVVPPELFKIIEKMMALEAKDRYPSATEVLKELKELAFAYQIPLQNPF
jgi:serine/threonine protein kinase